MRCASSLPRCSDAPIGHLRGSSRRARRTSTIGTCPDPPRSAATARNHRSTGNPLVPARSGTFRHVRHVQRQFTGAAPNTFLDFFTDCGVWGIVVIPLCEHVFVYKTDQSSFGGEPATRGRQSTYPLPTRPVGPLRKSTPACGRSNASAAKPRPPLPCSSPRCPKHVTRSRALPGRRASPLARPAADATSPPKLARFLARWRFSDPASCPVSMSPPYCQQSGKLGSASSRYPRSGPAPKTLYVPSSSSVSPASTAKTPLSANAPCVGCGSSKGQRARSASTGSSHRSTEQRSSRCSLRSWTPDIG